MANIKGRTSTMVNAFINTIGTRIVSMEDVKQRDLILQIKKDTCFYCNKKCTFLVQDHIIATCNTKTKQFGINSKLNKIISCQYCNSKK